MFLCLQYISWLLQESGEQLYCTKIWIENFLFPFLWTGNPSAESQISTLSNYKLKQTLLCFHRVESVVLLLNVASSQGLVLMLMWYHILIKFARRDLIPHLGKKPEFIITQKVSTRVIKGLINFVECQGFYLFLPCAKTVAESASLVSLFIRRGLQVHGHRSLV